MSEYEYKHWCGNCQIRIYVQRHYGRILTWKDCPYTCEYATAMRCLTEAKGENNQTASGCEYWDSESNFCALYRPSAVRHGRWIDRWFCSNYSGYDYGMTCSVCGKPMYRQLAEKMPPYCPNCGSRMDLEGDAE